MNSEVLMKMVAPEKYLKMADLFSRLIFYLRLLGLHKKPTTFRSICALVEFMGHKKKFTCRHLAQIKFLLPEAIQTDAVYVQDITTGRMKPDMNITLLFHDVFVLVQGGGQSESSDQFEALRQLFVSRLVQFLSENPGACDVPEAVLPQPFGHNGQETHAATAIETEMLAEQVPFHIHQDFLNLKIQDDLQQFH
ncbi:hypothetical protein ACE6H2_028077 [Prunus campanulata]